MTEISGAGIIMIVLLTLTAILLGLGIYFWISWFRERKKDREKLVLGIICLAGAAFFLLMSVVLAMLVLRAC